MCLFIESIKVHHRALVHYSVHADRFAETQRAVFGIEEPCDLRASITLPASLDDGLYKCRIVYSRKIHRVEFLPSVPKPIRTLRMVHDDSIRYPYKFADRSCIERLSTGADTDDILIVRNGLITDLSHANIVFFDGTTWVTPAQPLLPGTKRRLLLESGTIMQKEIHVTDIPMFQYAAPINAMLDIGDVPFIPAQNIFPPVQNGIPSPEKK